AGGRAQEVIVIAGTEQRFVGDARGVLGVDQLGVFGWHAPIAVLVLGHEAVLEEGTLVGEPLLHGRVVARQYALFAVLLIQHAGNEDKAAGPGEIVVVILPVIRRHGGDAAAGALGIGQVLHPFGVKSRHVEHVSFAAANLGAVAKPALALVTL